MACDDWDDVTIHNVNKNGDGNHPIQSFWILLMKFFKKFNDFFHFFVGLKVAEESASAQVVFILILDNFLLPNYLIH